MRCGSPWACPVCAPRLASRRAQVLKPQVAEVLKNGGASAWLITLTLRHDRHDDLGTLLDALRDTWGRVTSGAAWQRRRDAGRIEFVRGYDVTWGRGSGWHPHLHCLLLLDAEHVDDAEEIATWVRDRWLTILRRKGFDALAKGQDVQRCDDAEAAAAYAVTPAATYEALAMALKRARGDGAGLTPFELLSRAVGDAELPGVSQARAQALWVEYVRAVRGRRQTSTSQGITLASDEVLLTEAEKEAREDSVDVAWMDGAVVAELDRRRLTIPLLEAVEDARVFGMEAMRRAASRVLDQLQEDGWSLFRPPPLPDVGEGDRLGPDGVDLAVPW